MNPGQLSANPLRLLLEFLLIVGCAETLVMFALPWIAPGVSGATEALLDAAFLTTLVAPALVWRFSTLSRQGNIGDLSGAPKNSPSAYAAPLVVLLVGTVLTAVGAYKTHIGVQQDAQSAFNLNMDLLEQDVVARFAQPIDGLNGIAGLYNTPRQITQSDFRDYWEFIDIEKQFPGVRVFGTIARVKRPDLAAFVALEQADGNRHFEVRTSGNAPELFIVNHVVMRDTGPNALGIDLATEPTRAAVIREAIDSGNASLSGVLQLLPRQGVSKAGFLYMKALFRSGTDPQTPDQRMRALSGLAYASIVIDDMLGATLPTARGLMDYEVFEASQAIEERRVFDSRTLTATKASAPAGAAPSIPQFSSTRTIQIGGQLLTLRGTSTPKFESLVDASKAALVGLGGMLLTLFLSTTVWLLVRGRHIAEDRARQMTAEVAKLARVVELTNNSVIVADAQGQIEWVNAAFSRISGIARQDAQGGLASELRGTLTTDPEAARAMGEAVQQGVDELRLQVRNATPKGREYWLDIDLHATRSPQGELLGYVYVETDITQERAAAARMRAALRETQALMDTINIRSIVTEADRAGRITRVNEAFLDISGYTSEEVIGQNHRIVKSAVHPPEFWESMWRTISSGKPWQGEVCNRAKNGTLYWVDSLIAPFTDEDGKITKFVSIRTDITAKRLAQDELRASQEKTLALFELAPVGMARNSMDGGFLEINSAYTRMLGYSLADLQRIRYQDLTPEEYAASDVDQFNDINTVGTFGPYEKECFHQDGQRVPVRLNGMVITGSDGVRSIWTIVEDISAQKNFEARLNEARHTAEQASAAKGQFLANMSHEIRTPMNAILGMLQLLKATELSAAQFDYTHKTEGAAKSLLGLLNDILDFSKVEAGKMTLEKQPFLLSALMSDLSVILAANVGNKDLEVLFDISPAIPPVLVGDVLRLKQILINLAGNAVKFTSKGQVVIALQPMPPSPDAPQNAENASIVFEIRDSGIGIAPEHQQHIFTGFSQAEASTTRKFGGTGLGLAISLRLVEMMGGNLTLTSVLGTGSTFRFELTFPVVPAGTRPELLPLHASAPAGSRRVLVVDDNPIARNIVAQITRSWQWPTTVAESGEEALEIILANARPDGFAFDVIYIDWHMPFLDGWETAKRIREISRTQGGTEPVIVMLTGRNSESLQQRTQDEQRLINGFLVKPFTPSSLQEAALQSAGNDLRLQNSRRSASRRRLTNMHILVAEDNLLNQQVAEELLMSEGATVSLAANGQLAVNAVAQAKRPFDAVLMDIQMPVLDGYAATQVIREQMGLATLPIIAMTANAMASDREACIAAGMTEHVGKPFDLGHLVSVLLAVTGRAADPGAQTTDAHTAESSNPLQTGIDVQGALARMSGLRTLYARTVRDLLASLPGTVRLYGELLQDGDAKQAAMLMHTLKGTAATVGATPLSQGAAVAEAACNQADRLAAARDHLPTLKHLVEQACLQLGDVVESFGEELADKSPTNAPEDLKKTNAAWQALADIAPLLAAEDFAALEQFAQSRPIFDALPVAGIEQIEAALQDLDLQAALQAYEAMRPAG